MKYVDPKNLAKLIECPVFMGVCLQDKAAPPFGAFAAFNQCNGVKEYRIYPNDGHATPRAHISKIIVDTCRFWNRIIVLFTVILLGYPLDRFRLVNNRI